MMSCAELATIFATGCLSNEQQDQHEDDFVCVSFLHCIVTHLFGLRVYIPDYERTLHLARTLQASFLMDKARQIVPKQNDTTESRQDCHKICLSKFSMGLVCEVRALVKLYG